jgi:hypothetical protein
MTSIGQGFVSVDESDDSGEIAEMLFRRAEEDFKGEKADIGFIFLSSKFDVEGVVDHLGDKMFGIAEDWVGSTTAGEISKEGSTIGGAVLVLADLEDTEVNISVSRNVKDEPMKSGKNAINGVIDEEFIESDRNKAVFTIMPGLTLEEPGVEFELLKGMTSEAGIEVPIVGGSSGDDGKFEENYQLYNGGVYQDAVVTISFLSEMNIAMGKEHGFTNKIDSGVVSSSDGRVIEEINGQPALEFYSDAIGVDKEELADTFEAPSGAELSNVMRYALEHGIAEELSNGELRLMTPLQPTEDGGLFMTVDVEESSLVHIVEGENENLVNAAQDAFDKPSDSEPVFSLVSDCTCRNMALDEEDLEEEVSNMKEKLGCPIAGFYGYGELGGKDKKFCTFQNQTVSGLMFHK